MPTNTDLDHRLQLRLPKNTVADIDDVIATIPQLCGYNRCRFIRAAVQYALASIVEENKMKKKQTELTEEMQNTDGSEEGDFQNET